MKHLKWRSLFPLVTLGCLIPLTAEAQVVEDGTTSTEVNQDGNNFTINQGDRVGDHLFHSFSEFSVPTLGSAAFNNATDIANIFSRVTGSNISSIDGLIRANGAANLFLINPNGIIFGQNARLNLGGSFFASTADSLLFEGDAEFSAVNPTAPPLLTVSIPIGLNFRDNPGEIVNRSFAQNEAGDFAGLEVTAGKNLTLVGGNINFEIGRATARGGNIELGGLSAAGTVGINDDGSLSFPEDVAKADINLSNAADVDVRGTGGGSITVNAGNLNLDAGEFGSSLLRAGITSDSTSAEAQAENIIIDVAENITLNDSRITNQVNSGGVGNSGNITISTGSLEATNGGDVDATTFGQGNAGSVEITASDTITIDGEQLDGIPSGATSQVNPEAVGDGGNAGGVNIITGSLNLTNGGRVSANTLGQGNADSVEITASDSITFDGETLGGTPSGATSGVGSEAVGDAEGVTITTGSLNLTNGGRVSASTNGQGNAGSVEITASDSITIDGEASNRFPSSVTSEISSSDAVGDAGGVTITTGNLNLTNGGVVDATTFGRGNAGSVAVEANSINLNNQASINAVTQSETGNSANINLQVAEDIIFKNNSSISARALEDANSGNVTINADDGLIIAFPNQNNDIIANAARGIGGNINITTEALFGIEERPLNPFTNDINASSEFGLQGNIAINTPEVDPTSGLIELPASVGDASDQISQNPCQQGVGSEFIITGKGGFPANPHETLNSDGVRVGLVEPVPSSQGETVETNGDRSDNIPSETEAVPAMGWVFNEKGEVTLTAYTTTNTEIQRSGQKHSNTCSSALAP